MHFQSLNSLLFVPLVSAQLNKLAKEAGLLYFGTATDNDELSNKTYFKILTDTQEFGQFTPANGMKWFAIEPELNVFNYSDGAVVANLALKSHNVLRCHNLVWHSQLADWVTADTWTKENFTAALISHITHEVTHWKGHCYAWDVVNEPLNDDGTMQNNTFYQILGKEYIKIAFETAAKADPHAKLYINDFNIEGVNAKSNSTRDLFTYLHASGITKNLGVGLQGHFIAGESPSRSEIAQNMALFSKLGLEVALTELDSRVYEPENSTNLEAQKGDYINAVGACVDTKACVGVTVWDFYDPFSWVPSTFPGQGSATLYFSNFTKHPAYYGIVDVLKNAIDCGKGKGKGWY